MTGNTRGVLPMHRVLRRARYLRSKLLFSIWYRPGLQRCGPGAYIAWPCLLENPRHIEIGAGVVIREHGWLAALPQPGGDPPRLTIGEGTYLGRSAHIISVRSIEIGPRVLIADKVYLADNTHGYEDITTPVMDQPVVFAGEVSIGEGSWIGENVCIIGARIGTHCVIGANSVVQRDIPDRSVAVGAPARIVKRYDAGRGAWRRTDRDGNFPDESQLASG
jgi:acetyltransferase-like isoleucine patch superfamily enzyme